MEVIYTGLHQTPEQIAATVVQEDATPGLPILSGAHMTLVPRIAELLKEEGVEDVVLTVGGTIPADDIPSSMPGRGRGLHAGQLDPRDHRLHTRLGRALGASAARRTAGA